MVIQLKGKPWYYLFGLSAERRLNPHRKIEASIVKIVRDSNKLDFLLSLYVFFCDEIGQSTVKYISRIDIILHKFVSLR